VRHDFCSVIIRSTTSTAHSLLSLLLIKRRAIKSHNRNPAEEQETMNATQDNNRSRQGRIPATLQAVFLASNRGKEVNKPPPAAVASKVFFRNWLFQRQTGATKEKAGLFSVKKNKKSKRSKNQLKKPVLQERVAQTPKVKVCQEAESPCMHSSKWEQALDLSTLCLAHTPLFFALLYRPPSRF
jgi:hypothetical protein